MRLAQLRESNWDWKSQVTDVLRNAPTATVPKGTLVYHGTDADEALDAFQNAALLDKNWPFWVSTEKSVAARYAKWQRSGDLGVPQIAAFQVTRPIKLPVLTDAQLRALTGDDVGRQIPRLGELACALRVPGWINKGTFNEIMLCVPGDFLETVGHEYIAWDEPEDEGDDEEFDDIDKAFM